ncbi:hypothetical protein BGX26_010987 [Mortierella sp. AD094]|nr:hypothetical protein BGX26_010987 [Mortierella sp. AD094]
MKVRTVSIFFLIPACFAPALHIVQAEVHMVTVDDAFNPPVLCIQAGDTVQWLFQRFGHSIEETVEPGSCISKKTWFGTSPRPKWTWNRQFDKTGVVSYMSNVGSDCNDGMKGVIYVGFCPATATTTKTKSALPSNTADPTVGSIPGKHASVSAVRVSMTGMVALTLIISVAMGEFL